MKGVFGHGSWILLVAKLMNQKRCGCCSSFKDCKKPAISLTSLQYSFFIPKKHSERSNTTIRLLKISCEDSVDVHHYHCIAKWPCETSNKFVFLQELFLAKGMYQTTSYP